MSHKKLEEILDIVEFIPVGMIRGRTIKNGTLICDEAQNLTYQQLKAILTRLGKNSKIILCGDPDQSDLNNNSNSDLNPLTEVSNKLQYLKEASIIRFTMKDQMRDEFVNEVINCLK
jgi:phosphate starvation-inducible PhoH-like protein